MGGPEISELTRLYLDCHNAVKEIIKTGTGRYPRRYKRFEKARIDKMFRNVSYKGKNVVDFSAELMSRIIVIHGLPNTNHRSTIFFISVILHEMGILFPDYDTRRHRRKWIDECNSYITRSKRILYRRKMDPEYREKHHQWTKEWLEEIIGGQSRSSGMMSRHRLSSLKKISSSSTGSVSAIEKK